MKTFIAAIALTLSLGALANTSNTMTPGYSDSTTKTNQQRMEETKTKTKHNMDGTVESKETTRTREDSPMLNSTEKDTETTHKNTRRVR